VELIKGLHRDSDGGAGRDAGGGNHREVGGRRGADGNRAGGGEQAVACIGCSHGLVARRLQGGAEGADPAAERAVARQGGLGITTRDVDGAAVARRRVVELVLGCHRHGEGNARRGRRGRTDHEVRGRRGGDGEAAGGRAG